MRRISALRLSLTLTFRCAERLSLFLLSFHSSHFFLVQANLIMNKIKSLFNFHYTKIGLRNLEIGSRKLIVNIFSKSCMIKIFKLKRTMYKIRLLLMIMISSFWRKMSYWRIRFLLNLLKGKPNKLLNSKKNKW